MFDSYLEAVMDSYIEEYEAINEGNVSDTINKLNTSVKGIVEAIKNYIEKQKATTYGKQMRLSKELNDSYIEIDDLLALNKIKMKSMDTKVSIKIRSGEFVDTKTKKSLGFRRLYSHIDFYGFVHNHMKNIVHKYNKEADIKELNKLKDEFIKEIDSAYKFIKENKFIETSETHTFSLKDANEYLKELSNVAFKRCYDLNEGMESHLINTLELLKSYDSLVLECGENAELIKFIDDCYKYLLNNMNNSLSIAFNLYESSVDMLTDIHKETKNIIKALK